MSIYDLETPAILIDPDTLDRNLRSMASYCANYNLALRPHTKTHKMPEIARLQMEYGAPGITVAKLGEAEVMADAGISDIVVVYPLWGDCKWRRLVDLAKRIRIAVTMDSLDIAQGISKAAEAAGVEVGIRLEFDTGLRRCGLPVHADSIDIAHRIMAVNHFLSFDDKHAGEKFQTSLDLKEAWGKFGPKRPEAERWWNKWESQVTHYDHSYVTDLMDRISGMKPAYQAEWLEEYAPYRMGTALGRWDAEFEYWRGVHDKLRHFNESTREGDVLPPLDQVIEGTASQVVAGK